MAYIRMDTSFNNSLAEIRRLLKKGNNYNKLPQSEKNALKQQEYDIMMNNIARGQAEKLKVYQQEFNKGPKYTHNYNANIAKWRAGVTSGKINITPRVTPEPVVSEQLPIASLHNEEAKLQTYWNSYPGSNEHKKNLAVQAEMKNYYAELAAEKKKTENNYKASQKLKTNAAHAFARTRAFGPSHGARKNRKTRKNRR